MPTLPMFRPEGQTIAELLMRQGDIAGRAALARGAAWGNAIAGIGEAAAGAYTQYKQQKDQKKREDMLSAAMASFNPENPMEFYRRTAVAVGPEAAMRVTSGMASLMKMQTEAQPDPKDAATVLSGVAAMIEKAPGAVAQNWPAIRQAVGKYAPMFGLPVPEEYTPEVGQQIMALNAGLNKKTDESFNLSPGQVRFDASGKQIAAVPKEPEAFNLSPGQVRYQGSEIVAQGPPKERDPIAAAMAQARLDAMKEKELEKDEEVESYVNAVGRGDYTIDKVPPTIQRQVMVAADKRGFDTRTSKQKETDAAAEQTIEALQQLREQAEKTMTATTGPGAKIQGAAQRGLAYVGLAEQTQKWDKQKAKLSLLARQLGEKGVLTDRDVERVENILPALTEKASIRDKALKDVEDIIFMGLRGRVSARVKVPGGNDPVMWTHPNGSQYRFRSAADLAAFKKAAGVK